MSPDEDEATKPAARRTKAELAGTDAESLGAMVAALVYAWGTTQHPAFRDAYILAEDEARALSEPLSRIVQRMSPKAIRLVQTIADPVGCMVGCMVIVRCIEERKRAIIQEYATQGIDLGAAAGRNGANGAAAGDPVGGGSSVPGATAGGAGTYDLRSAFIRPESGS